MFARKFAYEVMAAGPFIMLGAIGIHARTTVQDWTPIEYGPSQLQCVRAYIAPVRASSTSAISTPQGLRAAADAWLDANRKGLLKDVYPVAVGENAAETPRGEILDAKYDVSHALVDQAQYLARRGQAAKASALLADAFEIAAIGKYGSFESVVSSCSVQQAALLGLREHAASIPAADRAAVVRRILSAPKPNRPLDKIVAKLRGDYVSQLQRTGQDTGAIEVTQVFGKVASLAEPDDPDQSDGDVIRACAKERNTDLTYAAVSARRARISDKSLEDDVARTLALLR